MQRGSLYRRPKSLESADVNIHLQPSRIQRWSSPRGLPSCTGTRRTISTEWIPALIPRSNNQDHPTISSNAKATWYGTGNHTTGAGKAQWAACQVQAMHTSKWDKTPQNMGKPPCGPPSKDFTTSICYFYDASDSKRQHHLKTLGAKNHDTKCAHQQPGSSQFSALYNNLSG